MHALIFEFDGVSAPLDDFGDIMFGFYYQLIGDDEAPVSFVTGPYGTNTECESAAQRAYEKRDY